MRKTHYEEAAGKLRGARFTPGEAQRLKELIDIGTIPSDGGDMDFDMGSKRTGESTRKL